MSRISAAIAAGRAESTRKTYASAWRRFERWCADRSITSLPATPATVCAYLADFAQQGVVSGTIEGACAAIADAHTREGQQTTFRHRAASTHQPTRAGTPCR